MEKNSLTPLVSVIIPAYNAEKYIADTIDSVKNQTYPNIEIIIVNDGSTDNTQAIIEKKTSHTKIHAIHQKNKGASAARNAGYARASGSYIKFLDGDDLINTVMIKQQMALAIVNDQCIISAKWGRFYNDDINTFKLASANDWQSSPAVDWLYNAWKEAQPMTQPGIFLIPKTIIEKAGLWDETLSLLDDTEYFTRTILACKKVVFCDSAMLYYRSGLNNSLSGKSTRVAIESAFRAIEKSTNLFISKSETKAVKVACANSWQSFIYWIYPLHSDLTDKAKQKVNFYGGTNLKFQSGGYSKILQHVIGWKLTKKLKLWLSK